MARSFWVADSETDPFLIGRFPKPFIFGLDTGDDYMEFLTAQEFIAYVREFDVVIYAHNGGKFDWHFILEYLEEQTEITVIAGRLAKFKIGKAEFRDSMSLFPMGLGEYQKDKIDYAIFEDGERQKPKNWDRIRAYLRSDCRYLYQLLEQFFKDYGRQITLASAAMAQWRKISKAKCEGSTADFYEEIAPYYYGGRVQCFVDGIYNKPFKLVDIRSAYPRAMKDYHPWGVEFDCGEELPKGNDAISRCFITLTAASTGVFPWRPNGGGLEFPADHEIRTFHITGWEYLAAIETGHLSRSQIIKVYRFFDKIEFGEYVDHFFAKKSAAKKGSAEYLFAKLFLNSLYGKWSANPAEYSEFLTVDPREITAHETLLGYELVQQLHNVAIMCKPLEPEAQRYYNVAVGASITGWVRAHLWKALCSVGKPLYCDTDCIAFSGKGDLPMSEALGDWELEGEFKSAAIAGKKLYAFEYKKPLLKDGVKVTHKIASKGVKLNAKQIIAVAKGETVAYENEAPTFGLRGRSFIKRNVRKTAKQRQTK